MSTIKDKLNFISNCKYEIGDAIRNKLYEQKVYDFDSSILSNYANRINSLNIASIGDLKKIGYEPLFSDLYLEYSIEFKNKWEQSDKTNLNALYDQNYSYRYIKFFPIIDTSKITSLESTFMYNDCLYFPYEYLNFKNVINYRRAFMGFGNIYRIFLNSPNATNFTECFANSHIMIIDISQCKSVTNFDYAFSDLTNLSVLSISFKSIDLGNKLYNQNISSMFGGRCFSLKTLYIYDLGYKETFDYIDFTQISSYNVGISAGFFISNNYDKCFDRRSAGYKDCEIVLYDDGVIIDEKHKQQFENKGYKFTTKPIPL